MCLRVSYNKNINIKFFIFCILKVTILKKGVEFGFISQRYGSADPDLQKNVMDPQHCYELRFRSIKWLTCERLEGLGLETGHESGGVLCGGGRAGQRAVRLCLHQPLRGRLQAC
jgi:hypothetical protein